MKINTSVASFIGNLVIVLILLPIELRKGQQVSQLHLIQQSDASNSMETTWLYSFLNRLIFRWIGSAHQAVYLLGLLDKSAALSEL